MYQNIIRIYNTANSRDNLSTNQIPMESNYLPIDFEISK